MQAILTAVWGMYNADATLKAALSGGLYLELAPQGNTLPYATYHLVSSRPEYWFGGRKFEMPRLDFNIYADTNAKRLTAYNALLAVYDDATPTVTGYSSIIIERVFDQFMRDGEQNEIFRAIVTYECRFLKT